MWTTKKWQTVSHDFVVQLIGSQERQSFWNRKMITFLYLWVNLGPAADWLYGKPSPVWPADLLATDFSSVYPDLHLILYCRILVFSNRVPNVAAAITLNLTLLIGYLGEKNSFYCFHDELETSRRVKYEYRGTIKEEEKKIITLSFPSFQFSPVFPEFSRSFPSGFQWLVQGFPNRFDPSIIIDWCLNLQTRISVVSIDQCPSNKFPLSIWTGIATVGPLCDWRTKMPRESLDWLTDSLMSMSLVLVYILFGLICDCSSCGRSAALRIKDQHFCETGLRSFA